MANDTPVPKAVNIARFVYSPLERGMEIGLKLRALREERRMSQSDIEERTGLLSCYLSRIENGYTIPAIGTLEKLAKALDVPVYMLFFHGLGHPKPLRLSGSTSRPSAEEEAQVIDFEKCIAKMSPRDRNLFFTIATEVAQRSRR